MSLTHFDERGAARMVDVGDKPVTRREAVARGAVRLAPETFRRIADRTVEKGDVLGVARVAGIMAAKRTGDLIPMCHPLGLESVTIEFRLIPPAAARERERAGERQAPPPPSPPRSGGEVTTMKDGGGGASDVRPTATIEIEAVARVEGKTGVEMEALVAVSVAALTIYDMCKAVDRGLVIDAVRLVRKRGGKSGAWARAGEADLPPEG